MDLDKFLEFDQPMHQLSTQDRTNFLLEQVNKNFLEQGSLSVEEYTRGFEQLLIKCDFREDEKQTLARYLGGLDEKIAQVVKLHPYATLEELSSLAHKVELQKRVKRKNDSFKS